jgi:exosortase
MKESVISSKMARPVTGGAVLLAAFLWLYYPVIAGMVSEWYAVPDHSHGFIIPFIAGYFVWRNRQSLQDVEVKPTGWGVGVLSGGLVTYVLGNMGAAYTTMRVSMLVVLSGIILAIYGKELLKRVRFPLLYLLFMIPVPSYLYDAVAFPLRLIVTKYSVLLIGLIGIPVLREGNIIMLENITLQVIDACSGIRSLTALLAIAVAFAYVSPIGRTKKVILALSAVPIAIAANITRLVATGVLAQVFERKAAEGFFHEFAGMGVFIMSLVLLISLGVMLKRFEEKKARNKTINEGTK